MTHQNKLNYVEAYRWFQNGDHPNDYDKEKEGFENGEFRNWTGAEVKAKGWEGQIVRYFRNPEFEGTSHCPHCHKTLHEHGWIDTPEVGYTVCPGDWIISDINGRYVPCKPDLFDATYEQA